MTIDMFACGPCKSAVISDCGCYRYRLDRTWDEDAPVVCWIMLNPSDADGEQDDPTMGRVITFFRRAGFGGAIVVNAFAWRSPSPKALIAPGRDIVGPEADHHIRTALAEASAVVCGWGGNVPRQHAGRTREILVMIRERGHVPLALAVTKSGHPAHPLYLRGDLRFRPLAELMEIRGIVPT